MNNIILMVSNGFGEDVIGAEIIKKLQDNNDKLKFFVLPMVGEGESYRSLDIKLVGPAANLPSGGFARNSLRNLLKDIKAGLPGMIYKQIKTMRRYRNKVDLIITVGDVYNLLLTGIFGKKNIVYLPTAKSEYIDGHYRVEKLIMKKFARTVIPRDKKTAEDLKKSGINASFIGNMMMDCFQIKGVDFCLGEKYKVIGLLPGSREEAYENLLYFLKIIKKLEKYDQKLEFITAMAGNLKCDRLKTKLQDTDWSWAHPSSEEKESGIYLLLKSPSGKSVVKIIYHHFGDVLQQADIFLGQAGTANEQAAGMGKPVIIFPGKGAQFTAKFAKAQKSLLGDSVLMTDRDSDQIAASVMEILDNNDLYHKMSQTGKKRMGSPGGTERLAEVVVDMMNIN